MKQNGIYEASIMVLNSSEHDIVERLPQAWD